MVTSRVRSHPSLRALVTGFAVAVTSCGLVVAAAPRVHADDTDDAFLDALKAKGIEFTAPQDAIVAAHEVCNQLGRGQPNGDVAAEVMRSAKLSPLQAGYFVGASVAAYCPKLNF